MADDAESGAGGMDVDTSDASESGMEAVENVETTDTELYSDETMQELYDPGYDPKEYEAELMDFSYEKNETKEPMVEKYNSAGEKISGERELAVPEFAVKGENYHKNGLHEKETADWESFAKNSDENGFEKGSVEIVTLEKGTVFGRYGNEMGRFATEPGTKFENLSLPYDEKTCEYEEYRVVNSFDCQKGTVAPNFDQPGKGTQYMFEDNIAQMIKDGKIERVERGE